MAILPSVDASGRPMSKLLDASVAWSGPMTLLIHARTNAPLCTEKESTASVQVRSCTRIGNGAPQITYMPDQWELRSGIWKPGRYGGKYGLAMRVDWIAPPTVRARGR